LRERARGYLTQVHVVTDPDAMLVVDGAIEALSANQLLELDPGDHTVEFRAAGYRTEHRTYSLLPGQLTTWIIQLEAEAPARASAALAPAEVARLHVSGHMSDDKAGPVDSAPGRAWLFPTGLALSFVGVATVGAGAGFLASYYDEGGRLRRASSETEARYETRWTDARGRALWTASIGSGVLALGAAALSDGISPNVRSWLSPTLLALGVGAFATGLSLYAANACTVRAGQDLQACSASIERRDTGSLLAVLSAPLLTIPLVQAATWLASNK
jgi:hypothetical protein